MSIASYTELKAAVGRWLHRSDLAAVAPDLIMLAETRCNRSLRVRQMETESSALVSTSAVDLPADWLELIGEPTVDGEPLHFVSRDHFKRYANQGHSGNYYSIFGKRLMIGYQINDPVTLAFDYYTKIVSLSDAAPINWMLSDASDVYLYGALLEAEPYMKNDSRIQVWQGLLQVALTDLQGANDKAKYSGGTLVMGAPQ